MTVSRGLAELKMLDKRIADAIRTLNLFTVAPANEQNTATLLAQSTAQRQKVVALMKRATLIKRAIVKSNAETLVTVAGEQMTVAEAIDMRKRIPAWELYASTIKVQVAQATKELATMQARVDANAVALFGGENPDLDMIDEYKRRNALAVVGLEPALREAEDVAVWAQRFMRDIDDAMNVSNAITSIDITDED